MISSRRPLGAEAQANSPAQMASKDPFLFSTSLHILGRAASRVGHVPSLLGSPC